MKVEIIRVLKAEFDEEEFTAMMTGLYCATNDPSTPKHVREKAAQMETELRRAIQGSDE